MDTFQALMFYHLPPVGNSVCLHSHGLGVHGQTDVTAVSLFSSAQVQLYASGTAALAAAVVAAIKIKNVELAEVILPAYGCPDLVSAVEFAGAKPVLVDIEADRPWFDLAQLGSAITENTVAIVAVNLFGISERWAPLRELVQKNALVLIEDSAQYFPGATEQQDWQGDLVVFSFGRGKPVSLLGGGAVFANNPSLFEQLPRAMIKPTALAQRFNYKLKAKLYNAMISPLLYWLPQSLSFLHLGETRYHRLTDIEAMDQLRSDLLTCNISRYGNDADAITRQKRISNMLDNATAKLVNLPRVCETETNRRLLRYPLLLEPASRDRVYRKLKRAGLGVSIMYPASLPKIAGLDHILDAEQHFVNAEMFASRLITLPTHSSVSENDINKMKIILSEKFL